jgi:hypothetical protein
MSDWKDGNDKQVKNWKQKMFANWFKDENKKKGSSLQEKHKDILKNID